MIAIEETVSYLQFSRGRVVPRMLVRAPSRTIFDQVFGHRGPAKLIDKISHHTMSQGNTGKYQGRSEG